VNILVVDDDMASVKLTVFLLEDAGYRTFKAYNGQSALEALHEHKPDLVLLDVSMPEINGFDVCRQIRRSSDVPIIFLSARTLLQDRLTGLQIGGDDYLLKPFEPTELLARVQAVFRRSAGGLSNRDVRLQRGGITVDPVDRTVRLADGHRVDLTSIEFRLLYYLVRNSGRVLTPDQLLDEVWGYDYENQSNLVPVYIRRLRAKIEADSEHPRHIITVRNLGYIFKS